jgi:hypothetical protein
MAEVVVIGDTFLLASSPRIRFENGFVHFRGYGRCPTEYTLVSLCSIPLSKMSRSSSTTSGPAAAGAGPAPTAVSNSRIIRDADSIFEDMVDVSFDDYQQRLDELVDIGHLIREVDDDEDRTYFRAREGLSWSDVEGYACSVKKQIVLCLIDNPRTFFVLYNTQKGKLRIAATEIRSWASVSDKKVVAFLLVDNDKTLADQTADGVFGVIDGVAKIFQLSSNSVDKLDNIRAHIDAYAADNDGDYLMPVIVALNNSIQTKKVIALMNHIKTKVETRNSSLRYGVVFDEADKVYPPIRDQFKPLLVTDVRPLHRLGFVTATEGDLMDMDDYPECANAYMYPVPLGDPNYRAIHTDDATVRIVPHLLKNNNDKYADDIVTKNKEYVEKPVTLRNRKTGFRKFIVNSGAKTASMEGFAKRRVENGYYAITVNMMGVNVYRPGFDKQRYSSKGVRFSVLLFHIYTELALHDKPLFIIGRRKVDRGLGFHHAPRDGTDGLIWTDMILGRIDDKNSGAQKAGRLGGNVAHCPQFPVDGLTWWTDERTSMSVCRHNNIVDGSNTRRGHSAIQAFTLAEGSVPVPTRVISEHGPQVPVVVDISEAEYATIPTKKNTKPAKIRAVLAILERQNPALAIKLRGYECKEVTAPRDADRQSYKNHVGVAVRCFEKGDPCSVTISQDEAKKGEIWNCFIDKHSTNKRACFVYVNPPA